MRIAITRQVSPRLEHCALEFQTRTPIDAARAALQHRDYEQCLERLGIEVHSLPTMPELPDCVFVEDPAVVLDEIAVITRMGAESRRRESASLAEALAHWRPLAQMTAPATLEGGDVVQLGRTLYVGLSRRTNREGLSQFQEILKPFGYRVVAVPVTACLHLKSACCAVSADTVLLNRAAIDASAFRGCCVIEVAREEPAAADVLAIDGTVLIPSAFPRTAEILAAEEFCVQRIDVSELQKAEAGVTCMSLVFNAPALQRPAATPPPTPQIR